ncbi:hypothetical protein KEM55_009110, partial [Ascosphaera atra]
MDAVTAKTFDGSRNSVRINTTSSNSNLREPSISDSRLESYGMRDRRPREESSYASFRSSAYPPSIPFAQPSPLRNQSEHDISIEGEYGYPDTEAVAGAVEQSEEMPWGPFHPCFPHLNPHVSLGSPEFENTRVIRIPRDYMVMGDIAPVFSNLYPEILDPLLPESDFRAI